MKINLGDIDRDKPFKTHLQLGHRTVESECQSSVIDDLDFEIKIQSDPQGYVAQYGFSANVKTTCVTCGGVLKRRVEGRDWIALRMQQPDSAHIVLSESDMNTRFLKHPEIDLERFVDEVVELELPTYPRHGESETCLARKGETLYRDESQGPEDLPFSGLAGLVEESK